jgi:hypothetical protein
MAGGKRILVVGLHPDYVDFSKVPVPGLNPATLMAGLNAENAKLAGLGYDVEMCLIDDGATAESVVAETLARGDFDGIMVGAGLRRLPEHFLLFEKLINVVHRHAPASLKICFNTEPTDTAEAVRRWM